MLWCSGSVLNTLLTELFLQFDKDIIQAALTKASQYGHVKCVKILLEALENKVR